MQSPYFIPDQSYINALKMAANAGVDVMIPCKPDHPFVYWATFSYAAELLNSGVKIYTYQNGFIHSKVMMMMMKFVVSVQLIWIIVVSR